jgi:hypothetical protein
MSTPVVGESTSKRACLRSMGSARDPGLWERLMDKGFHFEVKTDKEGNVDTLATCAANLLLRLDNTLSTWVRQPSPSEKSALKIMALYAPFGCSAQCDGV